MDLGQFRKYLENLSDPKAEQSGRRTFWSRAVRDNARTVADALIMEEEGLSYDAIKLLTQTANYPEGVDVSRVRTIFDKKA